MSSSEELAGYVLAVTAIRGITRRPEPPRRHSRRTKPFSFWKYGESGYRGKAANASTSTRKSWCESRRTSTVVLVGSAGPK